MNKKAQIEIIGLMLIIILLAVLAVVFLRFALKPDTDYTSEARKSIVATVTIDSILKTSINDKTFENLVFDCYTGSDCQILTSELVKIMPKLMPKKAYYYTFKANNETFLEIGQNCLGIQSTYPTIIESIPFEISLKLC